MSPDDMERTSRDGAEPGAGLGALAASLGGPWARAAMLLGSLSALLAVALGAFGAHALEARVSEELLDVWETAVQYHLFHSLGLLLVGIIASRMTETGPVKLSVAMLAGGTALFSGSLYLLVLTEVSWLGAVTPFGGVLLLGAWAALAVAVWWRPQRSTGS